MLQFDVKTAFLYGDLDEDIRMRQPQGYEDENTSPVCHLKKSLYGLKQNPRQWNKKSDVFLRDFGLKACQADPCVYCSILDETLVFMCLYVGDGILFCKDTQVIGKIIKVMNTQFAVKESPLEVFLGIQI